MIRDCRNSDDFSFHLRNLTYSMFPAVDGKLQRLFITRANIANIQKKKQKDRSAVINSGAVFCTELIHFFMYVPILYISNGIISS